MDTVHLLKLLGAWKFVKISIVWALNERLSSPSIKLPIIVSSRSQLESSVKWLNLVTRASTDTTTGELTKQEKDLKKAQVGLRRKRIQAHKNPTPSRKNKTLHKSKGSSISVRFQVPVRVALRLCHYCTIHHPMEYLAHLWTHAC
jgi:hypothetical protein